MTTMTPATPAAPTPGERPGQHAGDQRGRAPDAQRAARPADAQRAENADGRGAGPQPGDPVIVTARLSKTFSHGGVQQHVLRNLDLEIRAGDFTVIMGPSGAGKSTLLYALSGMDAPTLGTITFDGEDISRYSPDRLAVFRRRRCGFVFQQIHLLDALSLQDNVLAVGLLTGRRHDVRRRAANLFDRVGLDEATRNKFPSMISGGEAQRAAVVRAMINEPAVLFADEPTGQLNSEFGQRVLDLLTMLHRDGQSIVMVTHDLRSALRGDRILYLRDGSIVGELTLPRYAAEDASRQDQLAGFLAEMGW
jgi:putative ABC transport system ATP-binding protein